MRRRKIGWWIAGSGGILVFFTLNTPTSSGVYWPVWIGGGLIALGIGWLAVSETLAHFSSRDVESSAGVKEALALLGLLALLVAAVVVPMYNAAIQQSKPADAAVSH